MRCVGNARVKNYPWGTMSLVVVEVGVEVVVGVVVVGAVAVAVVG
jgi:hypothetical protein